jgi:beta-phosphoglucomutase-like phosphatase (HAD superfamily)
MRTRALIFDLDGTIADTDAIHLANWIEVLRPHGIDVNMALFNETLSELPVAEVIDRLLPELSAADREGLIDQEREGYRRRVHACGSISGFREFVGEAERRGLRIALVSNAVKDDARNSLGAMRLSDRFDPMVFAEDVGVEKPDPTPYREALKRLDISPQQALAFEDSPSGLRGAVNAGIPVIGLASTTTDPDDLRQAGADLIIGDYTDKGLHRHLFG